MCDPITIAIAATAVAAAGTGFSVYQGVQQANYQGKIAGRNEALEGQRQQAAQDRQAFDRQQLSRRYAELKGSQSAALAANGLDANFGSARDMSSDTLMFQAEDTKALAVTQDAELRGFDINVSNFASQASAAKQQAIGTAVGGGLSLAGTALGGAAQYNMLKAQGFGSYRPKAYGVRGSDGIY